MYPVIFQIGPLTFYSYGVMLALAVFVCSVLMGRDAKGRGIAAEIIYDFAFWLILAGLLGARAFFVLMNLEIFAENPWEIIMVQHGGLTWQGGLLAGAATGILYVRHKRLSLPLMADLAAPYLALGQAIGRLGCFFNGCCYGRPVAWGVFFPSVGEHVHPTQLYDAGTLFFAFLVLKGYRKLPRIPGQVFALYLILASLQRFGVEFFRGDHPRPYGGLSLYQLISLGIFAVGVFLLVRLQTQAQRNPR